jgi:hypothetical protein
MSWSFQGLRLNSPRTLNVGLGPWKLSDRRPAGYLVPIRISLIEGCYYQGSYLTKGSSRLSWSHHFESFTVATITWLIVMDYLCHKWQLICSTCRKHFPILSSFMTYHRVCNKINTFRGPPTVAEILLKLALNTITLTNGNTYRIHNTKTCLFIIPS